MLGNTCVKLIRCLWWARYVSKCIQLYPTVFSIFKKVASLEVVIPPQISDKHRFEILSFSFVFMMYSSVCILQHGRFVSGWRELRQVYLLRHWPSSASNHLAKSSQKFSRESSHSISRQKWQRNRSEADSRPSSWITQSFPTRYGDLFVYRQEQRTACGQQELQADSQL